MGRCVAAQVGLSARQEAARQAASGSGPWDSVDPMPSDPAPALVRAVAKLRQQATALDAIKLLADWRGAVIARKEAVAASR